ncbi:MAG: tRNA 2-thiouridine(34) synthase MnmA [Patescibacteria group bacterium]
MKPKVIVALSGGVDSSVAAALLKEKGYDCIGVHLRFWNDPHASFCGLVENKCCTLESQRDAANVAKKLGMPFFVVDTGKEFKKRIVDYFLKTYAAGHTPNPCVHCNRYIKFGELLRYAVKMKADFIATGHYARVVKKKGGLYELALARDLEKDQTYFLYQLDQKQLGRAMFPLGGFLKSEIYALAKKYGFIKVAGKRESQGLCFFPEPTPENFLKRNLKSSLFKAGQIVDTKGRKLGIHQGLPLYTVGQRHGLNIGGIKGEEEGRPWYVIEINRKKNSLIVGHEDDLSRNRVILKKIHFISGIPTVGKKMRVSVRIRHRAPFMPAILEIKKGGGVIFTEKFLRGVSPGQAAVFYVGAKVLGGGIIQSATII